LNLPKSFAAHCPKDCFDLQLSPEFVEKNMVNTTNERATAEGAGSHAYKDWAPFDREDTYKMIVLLFVNGMSPKPQVTRWFKSTAKSRIFGNNFFASALDKKTLGGR
jgi:hypothetical protein